MVWFSPPRHRSRIPRKGFVNATTISSLDLSEGKPLNPHYSQETGRDAVTDETSRITTLRTTSLGEIDEVERKHYAIERTIDRFDQDAPLLTKRISSP